jgi:hypothetical protein
VTFNFTKYDMGNLPKGTVIQVTLRGSGANVRLMDYSNLQSYRNGRRHTYYGGGLVTRSPHDIVIPRAAHWYVTVDMEGLRGTTRSSVETLRGPLPPARSARPNLAPIRQAA